MKQLLICSLFFIIFLSFAMGQISPGDLSAAHANLEGISNCTQCHELGKKVLDSKCLDCHTEIATRINNNKGYHATEEVKGKSCTQCHSEHHGRDFDLKHLDEEAFDHDITGFHLEGEHVNQDCKACHKAEFVVADDVKEKKSTFLGLSQECLSCHKDYHRETLTDNCTDCHGFDSFKPAPGFDHDKTDFTLLGSHKKVDCIDCHKKELMGGETFQHFSNVAHSNCTSCHEDVHDNKFGQNCTKCHSEESFHSIKGMDNFDHNTTGYPLEGMHANVDCKSCHKTNYTDPLKHALCSNCHTDYHKGEMKRDGVIPDCESCHTVKGFTNSYYSFERHNTTAFKLEGAHMATPCFSCHKKQEDWHFKNIGLACNDCHDNIHDGFMSDKFTQNEGCKECHSVNQWSELSFDHEKTDYSLLGAHATADCHSCHFRENDLGQRVQTFKDTKQECLACHNDEHVGQFEKYGDKACEKCHEFKNWEAVKFNHDNSRFKLEGAHASVECVDCHTLEKKGKDHYVKYIFEDVKCATCHK
jgi:hypothetical protein